MLNIVLYICLFLFLLTGLAIAVMALPGLWLMLAAAAAYAWATHWQFIGLWTLVVLLVLAVCGEVVEIAFQGAGAMKAGAGRRGTWGALIGGILGGIFLSVIPVPVLSTLVGVCIGTFLGALIGELSGGRDVGRSALIGVGAAKGRLVGTLAKVALGGIMLGITLWMGLPLGGHRVAQPPSAVFDRRSKHFDERSFAFGGTQPRAAVPHVVSGSGSRMGAFSFLAAGALPTP